MIPALRLIAGGLFSAGIGIWWIIDGLTNGLMNQTIGGVLWKGPILVCAGLGLTYYGFRLLWRR